MNLSFENLLLTLFLLSYEEPGINYLNEELMPYPARSLQCFYFSSDRNIFYHSVTWASWGRTFHCWALWTVGLGFHWEEGNYAGICGIIRKSCCFKPQKTTQSGKTVPLLPVTHHLQRCSHDFHLPHQHSTAMRSWRRGFLHKNDVEGN